MMNEGNQCNVNAGQVRGKRTLIIKCGSFMHLLEHRLDMFADKRSCRQR